MDRLSIDFICGLGIKPAELIRLAAGLGVGQVSIGLSPVTEDPHGVGPWDLRQDAGLVREARAALDDTGVRVALGECFVILPDMDVDTAQSGLDVLATLGAPRANCLTFEPDQARARDQFARLAELSAARGMDLTLEFMPMMWPATPIEAQDLVVASGASNGRLLIDAMHFYRSGATTADLARLDPALIGYVQLCDVPMPAREPDYGEEARHNRLPPGEGDLPLAGFLAGLPRDVTVGLEIPMLAKARAGVAPADAMRPVVETTRRLLAGLD